MLKIFVNAKPVNGPWGGGNLFLKECNRLDIKVNNLAPTDKGLTEGELIASDQEYYEELHKSYLHLEELIKLEMNLEDDKRELFVQGIKELKTKLKIE